MESLCCTVKRRFREKCNAIQVSPIIASCNAVGSREAFPLEKQFHEKSNGATCFSCHVTRRNGTLKLPQTSFTERVLPCVGFPRKTPFAISYWFTCLRPLTLHVLGQPRTQALFGTRVVLGQAPVKEASYPDFNSFCKSYSWGTYKNFWVKMRSNICSIQPGLGSKLLSRIAAGKKLGPMMRSLMFVHGTFSTWRRIVEWEERWILSVFHPNHLVFWRSVCVQ